MSTLVLRSADGFGPRIGAASEKPSLFQRFIKAREDAARRRILTYLAALPDRCLSDLGYAAEDIEVMRRGEFRFSPAR